MSRHSSQMSKKDIDLNERARRAFHEANKLKAGLRTAARVFTGNPKLDIVFTADRACTDGYNEIWLRVPPALADMPEHQPDLCQKRDEDLIQRCPKCAVVEDVNITLMHEIAHIIHDTFEKVSPVELADLAKRAIMSECSGAPEGTRAAKIARKVEDADARYKQDYLNLLGVVSPFLPVIFNACEDVRVNRLMQQELPGTKTPFNAQTNLVFKKGIDKHDGTTFMWRDAPLNPQAIIGIYCKVSGLTYKDWLDPDVVARLEDARLDEVCAEMADASSARGVYRLCYPLLENLRRLGFCLAPEDEQDDPEPEPEVPEQEEEESTNDEPDVPAEGDTSDEEEATNQNEGAFGNLEDGGASEETSEGDASDQPDDADASEEEPVDEGGSESGADSAPAEDADSADAEADGSSDEDDRPGDEEAGESDSADSIGDEVDGEHGDDPGDEAGESSAPGSEASDGVESGDGAPGDEDATAEGSPGSEDAPLDCPRIDADNEDGPSQPTNDSGESGDVKEDAANPVTQEEFEAAGTPDEMQELLNVFGGHPDKNDDEPTPFKEQQEQRQLENAIERAIDQVEHFDRPSINVGTLKLHKYEDFEEGNFRSAWADRDRSSTEMEPVPERILVSALQRLRLAFQDNLRATMEHNLKSGRVNSRALGKRIATGDPRLFQKKTEPNKRDYFVVVGLDCSGSTSMRPKDRSYQCRMDLMKQACLAKCELLNRLGVKFAVYAHSGNGVAVEIFEIKSPEERWTPKTREALARLQPYSANLDGHTLEFYRKVAQQGRETDRIILYYTDGSMPLENYEEELEILQAEIKLCRKLNITLVAIGVESDDPIRHGLDTIRLDGIDDIPKVVSELRTRLLK